MMKKLIAAVILPFTLSAQATVVEIQTNLGTIEVNLFDNATPETVENFLAYVNNGSYNGSIMHRLEPNFVLQGGGYVYNGSDTLTGIETAPPVVNEPVYSNVRGTIAMAKLSGNPDSATVQWFINLENNSANLDVQNGGFTVFGQVTAGMDIVDTIAAFDIFNFGGSLGQLPLRDYTEEDFNGDPDNNIDPVTPDSTNFIIVENLVITDATVDTASGLNPTPNTLIDNVSEEPFSESTKTGAIPLSALLLSILAFWRRRV
ncbi:peptidylprolyl isomerase [Pleionea litopenaei]|uniref:Peptidyl-prolyl cis-trans isomerase n=1 Tax=Pleionea litopenaei TaxID=3070815 RepID=A0AA51X8L7_9GAMM|nr:peptidylprolyl isomerase [Pleionea sp. HL-JVS1]WMS89111.1 peptidylprolyl isomerase [Pleionea sp. HL-JVS1]